jgi:hypothetical protein
VGIGRDRWAQALRKQKALENIPQVYTNDAVVIMPDGRYEFAPYHER